MTRRMAVRMALALATEAKALAWETLGTGGRATLSALAGLAGAHIITRSLLP